VRNLILCIDYSTQIRCSVAAASPIRLIVTSYTDTVPVDAPSALHFGHALENTKLPAMKAVKPKMACGDMKHMNKAIEMSNSLRKIFGFPEIQQLETLHSPMPPVPPMPPILPMRPMTPDELATLPMVHASEQTTSDVQTSAPHRHLHMHRPHSHDHGSFLRRIHRSLMALGTWEARMVAFVLGASFFLLVCPLAEKN
jgi:hypothetical protein